MRVYELYRNPEFNHPEDMKIILEYLNAHGKIYAEPRTIENLYYDFSDTYYAVWLGPNEKILAEFAEWLDEYRI